MEQPIQNGQYVALAKGNWVIKAPASRGGNTFRNNEVKGNVDIQIAKLSNQSLINIDKFTLKAFPSDSGTSAQSIHTPDYLGAVTGNRFCFVYQAEKNQRVFALYQIDEANKKVVAKGQFEIKREKEKEELVPTAIMAIKDKVFLGFPGFVGFVDLTQPTLSLNLFHEWKEQTKGKSGFLKTIDAFAFDSTAPNSELVAIDDIVWPKYAFTYNVSQPVPKNLSRFDLPSGSNEHYKDAVKHGNRLILTAKATTSGGYSNKIVVLEGTKAVWTITERRSPDAKKGLDLFSGKEFTAHSSVGLLNNNIIVITAGTRGVIAIPIDKIKVVKKEIYGNYYDLPATHGVKSLNVGNSAEELVTVKEKSTAYVLGTADNNISVLSEVKWNDQKQNLEVIFSHNLQGSYERLFMEV